MCGGTKFVLTTILIFMQLFETPVASNCGGIHDISYPFRLTSDSKYFSADRAYYELDCEGNQTIFTMSSYDKNGPKYYVEAINYSNSTIRLVDPGMKEQGVCSLPQTSITISEFPGFLGSDYCNTGLAVHSPILSPITIFSCPFSINSTVSVEITNCVNNTTYASSDLFKGHTYATIGERSPSFLRVGCTVDLQSLTSLQLPDANANISTLDLHNA